MGFEKYTPQEQEENFVSAQAEQENMLKKGEAHFETDTESGELVLVVTSEKIESARKEMSADLESFEKTRQTLSADIETVVDSGFPNNFKQGGNSYHFNLHKNGLQTIEKGWGQQGAVLVTSPEKGSDIFIADIDKSAQDASWSSQTRTEVERAIMAAVEEFKPDEDFSQEKFQQHFQEKLKGSLTRGISEYSTGMIAAGAVGMFNFAAAIPVGVAAYYARRKMHEYNDNTLWDQFHVRRVTASNQEALTDFVEPTHEIAEKTTELLKDEDIRVTIEELSHAKGEFLKELSREDLGSRSQERDQLDERIDKARRRLEKLTQGSLA